LADEYVLYCKMKLKKGELELDRLAYTLSARRSHLLWRSFALLGSHASTQIQDIVISNPQRSSAQTGIAFVFTGQGAQYAGMGLDLIQYPVFRDILSQINDVFTSLGCSWDLFGE
jgi:acyl transferase domain-containing protein